MQTRQRKSRPQRGEAVYEEQFVDCDQPNGYIIKVDHQEREVTVRFHIQGSAATVPRIEDFSFDDLEWTDKLGGIWLVRR